MTYVAELYVDTVNIIHFMHDKYAYEASQFALHDTNLERIAAMELLVCLLPQTLYQRSNMQL